MGQGNLPPFSSKKGGVLIRCGVRAERVAGPQQPWVTVFPESQRSQVGAR